MIDVDQLSYSYPRQKGPTLHDLSFSMKKGEVFGFLGPSGAGKSTTQKILIAMLKGYQGSVQVFGKEIREFGSDYYERIGVAFEFPHFYTKFTALENLRLFQSLYAGKTESPERLLKLAELQDAANMKFSQLSKGMKMRLNFCRALLNDPEILFLDEPTSGLDPLNAANMKEHIIRLKKAGKTIIITTHNMSAAEELCDRVAFIVDGRIKLIDSPRELKLRYGQKRIRVEYVRNNEQQQKEFNLDGIGHNEEFSTLLKSNAIETIHSMEATLEHIFIHVTGRRLT